MLPSTRVLSTRVDEEDQGKPGCQPVESRVHVDEVCDHRYVGGYDDLEVDNGEIHLAEHGGDKEGCGDEGDQRVGTVIEEDQFCRPADIDHIVQQAVERKEHHHDNDRDS